MNISNTVVSQSHNCWILMLPFNLLAVDTAYKSTAIENGHHVRIFLHKNIKNLEIPRIHRIKCEDHNDLFRNF